MINKNKKIFYSVLVLALVLVIFDRKKNTEEKNQNTEQEKLVMNKNIVSNKRSIASDKQFVPKDQEILALQNAGREVSSISSQDPITEVLNRYGINPQNKLTVNYDTWFVSTKYSQVHTSQFYQGMGNIIDSHNNFKILELAPGVNADNYPPLVVSYSTNRPVPITGDVLVKFQTEEDLGSLVNYLQDDSSLEDLVQNVIVTKELKDIRWILVKSKKKSQVMILYSFLSQKVGEYNIEAVQPDNRPELKY